MNISREFYFTYDHRLRTIGHPVRSAIHKPQIDELVVGWVTTSEFSLLYVFYFYFLISFLISFSSISLSGPRHVNFL